MQVQTGEGRNGRCVVEGWTEEREVLSRFGLFGEREGGYRGFLARLTLGVGRCFLRRDGGVGGQVGGLARAVAVRRCAGVGFGRAQRDGSPQSLDTIAQGQDAAVSLVLVQALPPVPFVVPVPVQFGEESVRGGGVGRRHRAVVVVVRLLGHERGQAGGVVEAEYRTGGRRRGQTTALVGVIGMSSETTKDAVWHSGQAEMPHQRERRKGRGCGAHGTRGQGCEGPELCTAVAAEEVADDCSTIWLVISSTCEQPTLVLT